MALTQYASLPINEDGERYIDQSAYQGILDEFSTATVGNRNGNRKSLPNNDSVALNRLLDNAGNALIQFAVGHDWSQLSSGVQTLTAGVEATVTLTPVPWGVSHDDVEHYIYISGGTGTAERVLITGGDAESGGATGTVTFTPAYNHSGAWTISSATAGIQEAANDCGADGGRVYIGSGTHSIRATIYVPEKVHIEGAGRGATKLNFLCANIPLFKCRAADFSISRMSMWVDAGVAALSGCTAIDTLNNGTSANATDFILQDLYINNFYDGVQIDSSSGSHLRGVKVSTCDGHGFVCLQAQGWWNDCYAEACAGNGFHLVPTVVGVGGVPPWMRAPQSFGCGGWGVYSEIGVYITDPFFNDDALGEVKVNVTSVAAGVNVGYIKGGDVQWAGVWANAVGNPFGFAASNTAPGIWVTGNGCINIIGVRIDGCAGNCLRLDTFGNQVLAGGATSPGMGAQAGHVYSVLAGIAGSRIALLKCGGPIKFVGGQHIVRGCELSYSSASIPAVHFAVDGGGTGYYNIFSDNWVNNAAGVAWQIDANVSMQKANNTRFSGTEVFNGSVVGTAWV